MSNIPNSFHFLQLRVYRRTFLMYLMIAILFTSSIFIVLFSNAKRTGQENFSIEANSSFHLLNQRLTNVTDSIDNVFLRMSSTISLKNDFFHFFGATPAEYAESLINVPYSPFETYLDACNNLVSETGFCIRHILHYSANNVIDTQYSPEGYSRHRIVSLDEADALCSGMFTYSKDIRQFSSTVGKVVFIVEPDSLFADSYHLNKDIAVCFYVDGCYHPQGSLQASVDWVQLQSGNTPLGTVRAGRYNLFYSCQASNNLNFSVIYVAPTDSYTTSAVRSSAIIMACVVIVFVLITLLYVRQFSRDSRFIQTLLSSMVAAQNGHLVPVEIDNRQDEFSTIAHHLNDLYRNLDQLIQQKYVLTINQQRTEMQMLSSQLNPHFLYNTLERIRLQALRQGAANIAEATANLGLLYRNIVKTDPIISIEKEVHITMQYLELMSFLYQDQFIYHCDIDDAVMELSTPKIWMQPIVENFFKHNFQHDGQLKVVVISGRRVEDGVLFEFFSNLGSISQDQIAELNAQLQATSADGSTPSNGIGLKNVFYRLSLFYNQRISMSVENNAPSGVRIQIHLKDEVST